MNKIIKEIVTILEENINGQKNSESFLEENQMKTIEDYAYRYKSISAFFPYPLKRR